MRSWRRLWARGILAALVLASTLALTLTPPAGAATTGTPTVSVSPSSLAFPAKGAGNLGVGFTSAAQTVTVKNTGTAPLQMATGNPCGNNPCLTGSYTRDYSIGSNTCYNYIIPAGTTCTFTVDFTPSTTNGEDITIDIYDNAASSPQTVAVSGQGTAPTASVSPGSLTFPAKGTGPLGVGMTSAAQTVTVKNTGDVPMQMATGNPCGNNPCLTGSYTGDYSIGSNTCYNYSIPAGTTCTFTVDFTPSTTNGEDISIDVYDTAAGSPQAIAVSGHGTAPTATVSPSKLSFFSSAVGVTSKTQTVTVKNTGDVPMQMATGNPCGNNPCLTGSYTRDYSIGSNTCYNYSIPAGTTCTFTVDFTPSTTNQEAITIDIYDTATGSPQIIAATGLATTAKVSVSTGSLSFVTSAVGATSAPQKVTVDNTGKVAVQMGWGDPGSANPAISTTYANDFTIPSNSCADHPIPAGTSCTFSVEYKASTTNDEVGTLTIYDNAVGAPQTISLAGQVKSS